MAGGSLSSGNVACRRITLTSAGSMSLSAPRSQRLLSGLSLKVGLRLDDARQLQSGYNALIQTPEAMPDSDIIAKRAVQRSIYLFSFQPQLAGQILAKGLPLIVDGSQELPRQG